jgi:hypothetical protein
MKTGSLCLQNNMSIQLIVAIQTFHLGLNFLLIFLDQDLY